MPGCPWVRTGCKPVEEGTMRVVVSTAVFGLCVLAGMSIYLARAVSAYWHTARE